MNQQVRDFVDGITADNLSDYFEIVKDYPVFSATPTKWLGRFWNTVY